MTYDNATVTLESRHSIRTIARGQSFADCISLAKRRGWATDRGRIRHEMEHNRASPFTKPADEGLIEDP